MVERFCINCALKRSIEVHHVSYKPPIIVFLCRKCHQEIHKNTPIEGRLTEVMRQYHLYIKLGTQLKNWSKSWNKQFSALNDEQLEMFLRDIERKQKELLKEAKYELGDKIKLCKNWKGIGVRHLAYMLAFADPNRFPSLRKFLYYCGRKQSAKITKKYSRVASTTAYQIAVSLTRTKNEEYYPLYIKIKKGFENDKRIVAHSRALNRVSTLWLKDFYTKVLNIT